VVDSNRVDSDRVDRGWTATGSVLPLPQPGLLPSPPTLTTPPRTIKQVHVKAPSEAAATALLQLINTGKLGVSLKPIPWPTSSSSSSHEYLPAAEVFSSNRATAADMAAVSDVVATPLWRRHGVDQQQAAAGGDGEAATPAADEGDEGEGEDAATAPPDPSAALLPSRLVSFLAGTLAPQLLHRHHHRSHSHHQAASTADMQLWRLRIGVTQTAFNQAATEPQDPARRPWQQSLLAVAAWLAPHWGVVGGAGSSGLEVQEEEGEADVGDGEGGEGEPADGAAAGPSTSAAAAAAGLPPAGPGRSARHPPTDTAAAAATTAAAPQEFDASVLYAWAKPSGLEPRIAEADVPAALLPKLRPYQARAVRWMLERERSPRTPVGLVGRSTGGTSSSSSSSDDGSDDEQQDGNEGKADGGALHPLWRRVQVLPGGFARCFYINPFSGLVTDQRFLAPPPVRGGIAADEMGLGKTVELMALLLVNRFQPPGSSNQPGTEDQQQQQQQQQVKEEQELDQEEEEEAEEGEDQEEYAPLQPTTKPGAHAGGACAECGGPIDPRATAPRLTQEHLQQERQRRAQSQTAARRPPSSATTTQQRRRRGPAPKARTALRGRGEAGVKRRAAAVKKSKRQRRVWDSDSSGDEDEWQEEEDEQIAAAEEEWVPSDDDDSDWEGGGRRKKKRAAVPHRGGRGRGGAPAGGGAGGGGRSGGGGRRSGGSSQGAAAAAAAAPPPAAAAPPPTAATQAGTRVSARQAARAGVAAAAATTAAAGDVTVDEPQPAPARQRRARTTIPGNAADEEDKGEKDGRHSAPPPPPAAAATTRGTALCGACLRRAALQSVEEPCGATLVIVPPSILPQWWAELHRHVRPGSVRIAVYAGQVRGWGGLEAGPVCL